MIGLSVRQPEQGSKAFRHTGSKAQSDIRTRVSPWLPKREDSRFALLGNCRGCEEEVATNRNFSTPYCQPKTTYHFLRPAIPFLSPSHLLHPNLLSLSFFSFYSSPRAQFPRFYYRRI